jgi:hypothetical protein
LDWDGWAVFGLLGAIRGRSALRTDARRGTAVGLVLSGGSKPGAAGGCGNGQAKVLPVTFVVSLPAAT